MKPRLQVSRAAIELIKTFEGYRSKAARLPSGRWTIGYGHTLTAREGAEVTADDAQALLLYDLIAVSHAVNEHVYTPLTQNQFDALACFVFSIGVEAFQSSAVLRRVNEGSLLQAAYAMEMWRRADFEGERIVIDALVRRRAAEKTLFLTPQGGWTPAPSPVLPPKIDYEVEAYGLRQEPLAVRSPLTGDAAVAERADAPAPAEPQVEAEPLTASEQAAAAVSARLESLLPDDAADEPVAERLAPRAPEAEAIEAEAVVEAESQVETEAPVETLPPRVVEIVEPIIEEPVVVEAPAEPEPEAPPPTQAERWTAPSLTAPETFTLSPSAEAAPVRAAEPEIEPERPAPQPGPSLFDIGPATTPNRASDFKSRIIDSFDPAFSLDRASTGGFTGTPLVALALVGLVVFAGGVFWGVNAVPDDAGGMAAAKAFGWVLGVIGVLCFGVAAYGLLRKLGGTDADLD